MLPPITGIQRFTATDFSGRCQCVIQQLSLVGTEYMLKRELQPVLALENVQYMYSIYVLKYINRQCILLMVVDCIVTVHFYFILCETNGIIA